MNTATKHAGPFGLASIIALTITLTGCTSIVGDIFPRPKPGSSSVAKTPEVAETSITEEELLAIENGAVLTLEQISALESNKQLGLHAYALPDGTHVLTSYREPLPDAVKVDVATKIAASNTSSDDAPVGLDEGVRASGFATGRNIIAIVPITGICNFRDRTASAAWTIVTPNEYLNCQYLQRDALASAEAFRAKQGTPSDWDIVIYG